MGQTGRSGWKLSGSGDTGDYGTAQHGTGDYGTGRHGTVGFRYGTRQLHRGHRGGNTHSSASSTYL